MLPGPLATNELHETHLFSRISRRGVFSARDITSSELPKVMCLYPGIHTPGIPIHAMGRAEYLASLSPPSNYGTDIELNAYIMNVDAGGYIDGVALTSQYDGDCTALDVNPSACGHLVNHDAAENNVEVYSFTWEDIFTTTTEEDASTQNEFYSIPNELRADGTPWYYDTVLDKLVSFECNDEQSFVSQKMVCGVALVLTKPVSQGDELLLDYGLKEPYPFWAKYWYNGGSSL